MKSSVLRTLTQAARLDIVRQRLQSQRLIGAPFERPEDAVAWLGAVQAQDYAGAKWALAQRSKRCSDAKVEAALQAGTILRTHVLRPTWHFVLPADIRWLLELTAPRVHAASAYMYRKLGLDSATVRRSNAIIVEALRGGHELTRAELGKALGGGRVRADGMKLGYLASYAELEGLICSGARRGKQFTYALLDERAPKTKPLGRKAALAELAKRYFQSHGPATLHDFAWWSGLNVTVARLATQSARNALSEVVLNGKSYWSVPVSKPARLKDPTFHLLPNYDEHVLSYKDYSPSFDPALRAKLDPENSPLLGHLVALNGQLIGGWRRTLDKDRVTVETRLLLPLHPAQKAVLATAVERYGRFLDLPASWSPADGRS